MKGGVPLLKKGVYLFFVCCYFPNLFPYLRFYICINCGIVVRCRKHNCVFVVSQPRGPLQMKSIIRSVKTCPFIGIGTALYVRSVDEEHCVKFLKCCFSGRDGRHAISLLLAMDPRRDNKSKRGG
uniref:Uncharacterized protein n=1 Tax=Paracidobacterium acidisoli TaxID=2303751 RepID=A0A372IKE8_9BACT